MYMCVRVVSGHVHVCYGSEWSCEWSYVRVVSGHVHVC